MKSYLALIVAFLAAPALADTPLPPPEKQTICSPSGNACATSDPATNFTLVSSHASRQMPWTIPGWHRWLFVSDDGESVVVGYGGMNLVPVDVTLKEPVFLFYNKGKLVRTVTLGDLYERKSQLRRTISHFDWAHIPGINQANQLVVELVNGKKVAFAVSTGQVQPLIPDAT
ncbi:hypothetical protein D3C81_456500 [compost metagenome]